MNKRALRFIVTGFDPFGGGKSNPSGELAQMFPDLITVRGNGECPVERLVLPTCCNGSWKVLNKVLDKFKNDDVVLVMTGLAEGRTKLSLERLALNLQDYRIKDNKGHKHPARKISPHEENALFSTVPVDKVKQALVKKGIPCDVSNHAGAFVCNDLYFRSLMYQRINVHVRAALFVHVPRPRDFFESALQSKPQPRLRSFETLPASCKIPANKKIALTGAKSARVQKATARSLPVKRQLIALMQESVQLALMECVKYQGLGPHVV